MCACAYTCTGVGALVGSAACWAHRCWGLIARARLRMARSEARRPRLWAAASSFLGAEIPNRCCLGGCCRLPVLLALCSMCHLSADGDLSPPPLLTPFAADRHVPAARSLLSAGSLLSLLLLLRILLQLSGGERAGSRCLCDDTRKTVFSGLLRRQVFLFVCLRFVDRNGCIKNKY